MTRSFLATSVGAALGIAALAGAPASADEVSKVYVGTFSSTVNADPSGLVRGGKYVVATRFDTDDLFLIAADAGRQGIGRNTYAIALDDAPGGTNTYQLFLPTQGYGVLTQTGQDHFQIDPSYAPTAEIQFFDACTSAETCAAEFRGFELESNFLRANNASVPKATDLVFEQFTADVNLGTTPVTNYLVNVLDEGFGGVTLNSGHLDVRSESGSASGGQLTPGVFFSEAKEVVAEAGPMPLVYSAVQQTVTTNAGTEQVTDPVAPINPGQLRTSPSAIDNATRQADNDLGAGRTDKEDFLDFSWTVNGNTIGGNLDGTRIDRLVEDLIVANPSSQQHGPRFANNGTRTVSGVNIAVAIQNSGLTSTIDTKTFALAVTESFTGKADTDTLEVSYSNAGPTADAGPALVFDATHLTRTADGSVNDPDLAVNSLIPLFEAHSYLWEQGSNILGTSEDPIVGIASSGLSTTLDSAVLELQITDRAGAQDSATTAISYANALPTIDRATATPQGVDLLFELAVTDADLAVNGLIADFEALSVRILVDMMDRTLVFANLVGTGSQLMDQATLLSAFGAGPHLFEARVSDRFILASGGAQGPVASAFQFDVTGQAPTPGTLALLAVGLLGLARRPRVVGAAGRRIV